MKKVFFYQFFTNNNNKNNDIILLKFTVPENTDEKAKRKLIEQALKDPNTTIEQWRQFAKSEYGLINGKRC